MSQMLDTRMLRNRFTAKEALSLLDINYDDLTICSINGCYTKEGGIFYTAENLLQCAVALRYKGGDDGLLNPQPILLWLKNRDYSPDLFNTKIALIDGFAIPVDKDPTRFGKCVLEFTKKTKRGTVVQVIDEIGSVADRLVLRGRSLGIENFDERIKGTALEKALAGYFQLELPLVA